MRDLSIRGAGNLLVPNTALLILSVLICMRKCYRKQSIASKGKIRKLKTSVEIDLGIDAYLPTEYMIDERQKIEIYKRIRELESMDSLDELQDDLIDRFGEYPDEVAHLLMVGEIKMNGDRALIDTIRKQGPIIQFILSKVGTKAYTVEQLFAALSKTNSKRH